MKKDNTMTVFYDEVTRKDIYRLNGIDVTDTIEMLKDKWEKQILDTRCRLFQLDMSIQQRLQDQVADLEAKLAEKETRIAELEDKDWYEATIKQLEKQNERLIKERDGNYENYSICWKENEQLKQQLAEKDELIENYKMGYTGKIWKKQKKEISVLKSVVKDKDEIIDKLNNVIFNLSYIVNNDANNSLYILEKVNDLKKQLAEKERQLSEYSDINNALNSGLQDRCICCVEEHNQDKISFAVEQLNLLYKTLTTEDVWRAMKKGWWLNNGKCLQLRKLIDNQIKQLKEKK